MQGVLSSPPHPIFNALPTVSVSSFSPAVFHRQLKRVVMITASWMRTQDICMRTMNYFLHQMFKRFVRAPGDGCCAGGDEKKGVCLNTPEHGNAFRFSVLQTFLQEERYQVLTSSMDALPLSNSIGNEPPVSRPVGRKATRKTVAFFMPWRWV